jgi:glutaminase
LDYPSLLAELAAEVRPLLGQGRVADYIPLLARADPSRFGLALAALDGGLCGTGDDQESFSIQSVSKVFALALTLPHLGEALWRRVGKEPSGNPFNSLVQLEYERGLPRNPFINAGALVVTDALLSLTGDACGTVLAFLQAQAGPEQVAVDEDIAESEWQHRDRNSALAHFMKSFGNLHNPVDKVLRHYFRQCSIRMNCRQLARAGLFLANHGLCPDGRRLLTRSQAKQINAIMLTCGTYDAAGEFAYRVGLPCKSGVGGGILAIIPNRMALATWSPGLDPQGNSLAGLAALDHFTTRTGLSIF